MKPTGGLAMLGAALLLMGAGEPPPAPAPAPAPTEGTEAPAASSGWRRQPGCAWRNYWSDAHHSSLTLEWIPDADAIGLTMISDAFAGWPAGAPEPVELVFGGADAPVTVDAHATTGGAYAILELPFSEAVEQGFARDSSMALLRGGRRYLNLDMAGTAAAIAAVRECPTLPDSDLDDLDLME